MQVAIIVLYLLVTLGIGSYLARYNTTIQQYFIAKSEIPILLIIPFAFAEMTAGASTIGTAADAYTMGFSGMWFKWSGALGGILVVLLASKFYKAMGQKYGAMSVAGAFGAYLGKPTQVVVMAFTTLVYFIIYSTQPTATAGVIAPVLNIDVITATWGVGILFVLITLLGGLRGVAWTNVLHTFVLIFGMGIAMVLGLNHIGGFETLKLELPATYFSITQPNLGTVLAWTIGGSLSYLAAGAVINIIYASKSTKVANIGIGSASILTFSFAFLPTIIGMIGVVLLGDGVTPNEVLFRVTNSVSNFAGTLAALAVLAAIISSAPAFLLVIVTSLTRDFYWLLIRPNASDKEQLFVSRVLTIVVGLLATYMGLHGGSILSAMLGGYQIRAIAGVVLVVALLWPRVNGKGAFWAILLGSIVSSIWNFSGSPLGLAPLWPALIVTFITLGVITLTSKSKISKGYKRVAEAIKELDEQQRAELAKAI